jgi:hypothetical protein|tara:strand:- start:1475 stop:1696 length:222 start_codon:yes stop_codon:yes gene_type:complete
MNDKLELDPVVLKKNLEITKLTRQIDHLISKSVDSKETKSQRTSLLIQENIDLKAQVSRLKDIITQLSDPLRR